MVSAAAGMFGNFGNRCGAVTAMGLIHPDLIGPARADIPSKITEMRPPTISCTACAVEGYGTKPMSMPARERTSSEARCGMLPRPAAAYRILPGLLFASAINSGSVFTPRLGGKKSAGARAVNDHRLLPPNAAEAVGNDPQDHVRAVSGRRLRDDLDRLAGIGTGMRSERRAGGQETNCKVCDLVAQFHGVLGLGSVGDNVTSPRYKQKLQDRITS